MKWLRKDDGKYSSMDGRFVITKVTEKHKRGWELSIRDDNSRIRLQSLTDAKVRAECIEAGLF